MPIDDPFSRSILRSSLLATTMLIGCKEPPSEHTEQATPERSAPGEATATHEKAKQETGHEATQGMNPLAKESKASVDEGEKRAESMVNEARAVAGHIDTGLKAIEAGHEADAKIQVAKALDELAELERERPTVQVVLELWRGNRMLEFVDDESLDTVPLLATLTRVDVPVYDREQIAARHEYRKLQAPGSITAKEKSTDLEIVDANLVYEEVDLPIASTALHVRDAQKHLEKNDLMAAKQSLQRAVDAVGVIEIVEEAPEYRARELVWAAETAFIGGDRAEARRMLGAATDLLAPLAKKDDDAAGREMVNILLDEMKPLQEALAMDTQVHEDEFRRLVHSFRSYARRSVLQKVMIARRETERLGLADALMWLENARTDGVGKTQSTAAASRDLARADTALANAIAQAPASAKPALDDVHARIAGLVQLDAATSRNADEIAAQLRGATFELRMLMLDLGVAPWPDEKKASRRG